MRKDKMGFLKGLAELMDDVNRQFGDIGGGGERHSGQKSTLEEVNEELEKDWGLCPEEDEDRGDRAEHYADNFTICAVDVRGGLTYAGRVKKWRNGWNAPSLVDYAVLRTRDIMERCAQRQEGYELAVCELLCERSLTVGSECFPPDRNIIGVHVLERAEEKI